MEYLHVQSLLLSHPQVCNASEIQGRHVRLIGQMASSQLPTHDVPTAAAMSCSWHHLHFFLIAAFLPDYKSETSSLSTRMTKTVV